MEKRENIVNEYWKKFIEPIRIFYILLVYIFLMVVIVESSVFIPSIKPDNLEIFVLSLMFFLFVLRFPDLFTDKPSTRVKELYELYTNKYPMIEQINENSEKPINLLPTHNNYKLTDKDLIIRLMITLDKIKSNNYCFIETEDKEAFEVYLKKYKDTLPDNYKIIVEKFIKNKLINPSQKTNKQISLSENDLYWLKNTMCSNGKPFVIIENNKLIWQQNRRNAKVFITQDSIRGDIGKNEAMRQAEKIFFDKYGNPLNNLKNTKKGDENTDTILIVNHYTNKNFKNFPTT